MQTAQEMQYNDFNISTSSTISRPESGNLLVRAGVMHLSEQSIISTRYAYTIVVSNSLEYVDVLQ